MAAIGMISDSRYFTKFIAPTKKPFVANLHSAVHECLNGGFDYLLLMDDDNPPRNNPLDLVELDLDVVGLPTPVWHNDKSGDRPFYYNALDAVYDEDGVLQGFKPLQDSRPDFRLEGLYECDAVGTGCVLIHRRVLQELMNRAKGNPMNTPFMRVWNDDGTVHMGNDYAFCVRAKQAGFSIHAHFDYMCNHVNEMEINSVTQAFGGLIRV